MEEPPKTAHVTADKLKEIELRREDAKKKGNLDLTDKQKNYKLVCPLCNKPNSLTVNFCTGCSFELCLWDAQLQSPNIFVDLINGTDIGANILLRSSNLIIFDDKFGVSSGHIDVIPNQLISDITELTKNHIPLLWDLYNSGKKELEKKNLIKEDIEKYIVSGFNYPVSIPHLHLHMVLPPFKHLKVFQYPRWHPFKKAISDLEKFGHVKTYDKHPNEEEGKTNYDTAITYHHIMLQTPSSSSHSTLSPRRTPSSKPVEDLQTVNIEDLFDSWREKQEDDCELFLIEVFKEKRRILFNYSNEEFTLIFPDRKDPLSVYRVDIGSLKIKWAKKANEYFIAHQTSGLSFRKALDKVQYYILKEKSNIKKKKSLKTQRMKEVDPLDFDFVIKDWGDHQQTHWYAVDVLSEVRAAQSFFESAITTYGTGSVSVKIDISEVVTQKIAEALEIDTQSPIFVHMDFSTGWPVDKDNRVPFPTLSVSQNASLKGGSATTFGVKYHLTAIVHRFLEDTWKWSDTLPKIDLGTFEDKGHNQDFSNWSQQRKQKGPAPTTTTVLPAPPSTFPFTTKTPSTTSTSTPTKYTTETLSSLIEFGFPRDLCITVLKEVGNNLELAMEKLLVLGEQKGNGNSSKPTPPEDLIGALTGMGFSRRAAIKALQDTNNNLDNAISFLLEGGVVDDGDVIDLTDEQKDFEKQRKELRSSNKVRVLPIDQPSLISRNKSNFFLSLISYVKSRLANFCRYCMICHVQHSCKSDKPVVCCNPLCIFRYSELLPQDKKEKLKTEVDRITICPFTNCFVALGDVSASQAIMAAIGDVSESSEGNTQQTLLEMHAHRYLPNHQVVDFIENGVKQNNVKIASIENVLKPELVVAFEKKWQEFKQQRGVQLATPQIAYHGTAEANITSILERGLLVPGKGEGSDVKHATDNGWWGGGIYLSPNSGLSISYCRGGKKLLICSVLMGKPYTVTERLDGQWLKSGFDSHIACNGSEWVIFEPTQILPCYLVSFAT